MVVRTDHRESSRNPLKDLAGYRQVVSAVLDAVDRKDGALPTQIAVDLSEEEIGHVVAAFRPNHFTRRATGVTLYPPRVARDEFDDKPQALLATWYADQRRTPRRLRAEHEERRVQLCEKIRALPDHPTRQSLLAEIAEGTGWVTGLLERQGVDAAAKEVCAVVTALTRLPLANPTRLKVFASQVLGSSHRLDPGSPTYNHLADALLDLDAAADEAEQLSDARRSALEDNNLVLNLTHPKTLVYGQLGLAFANETDLRVIENQRRGLAASLTLQELLRAKPVEPLPVAIITIENEDSFNDMASLAPREILLVFTSGHLNAATRALIRHPSLEGIPRLHWGDVDAGGFRILQSIQTTPSPLPILMDAAAVHANQNRLTKLDKKKRDSILRYIPVALPLHREALNACLGMEGYLEQEAVPAKDAMDAAMILLRTR